MKAMRWDWARAAAAAGAVWIGASGCQTVTTGKVGEPGATDTAGGVEASLSEARRLNIAVDAKGPAPVADAVRRKVENGLAEKQFNLDAKVPDIQVNLAVATTVFDKSGNYVVLEGTADASVTRAFDRQTVGHQTLTVRADRQLGEDVAARALGEKLGGAAAEWVTKTAASGVVDLAAVDVTVRRPWRPFSGSDVAAYAKLFTDRVSAVPGVRSCRVVSQENADRTLVFRVLYFRQEIPEGILNRIANVKDLEIRPR